jgi:hypothetical protein
LEYITKKTMNIRKVQMIEGSHCEISGSHGGKDDDVVLGCDAV